MASTYSDSLELYSYGDFPVLTEDYGNSYKHLTPVNSIKGNLASSSSTVEEAVYSGLYNVQDKIDISAYKISASELKEILTNIINTSPELFYVAYSYSYSPVSSNGTTYIGTLMPNYSSSGSTLTSQRDFYNSEIQAIIDSVDSSWSDLEKVVYIHDYIAQNFEYDTTYVIHDVYNFLKQKTGVCQSYTLLFCALMEQLGIDVSVAQSDSMNHIWNVVKINDKWYHVDITWDDPVSDRFSLAYHNYMLLSDSQISAASSSSSNTHHDWTSLYTCTDTTYDNYYWLTKGITTPFNYINGQWYYGAFDSNDSTSYIYSSTIDGNSISTIYNTGKWYADNSSSYYAICGSGLDVYDGKLYFNNTSTIYSYEPASAEVKTICNASLSLNIYGLRINDNILTYNLSSSPSGQGTKYTYTLPAATVAPSATPTATVTPSAAPSATVAPTATVTPTATAAATATPTMPPAKTPAATISPILTASPSPVISTTPTNSPAITATPTPTSAPANTPEITDTPTVTPTNTPVATVTPTITDTPTPSVKGDINFDGKTDLSDAQLSLKCALMIVEPTEQQIDAADIDGNGKIDLSDVQLILKAALGIISL